MDGFEADWLMAGWRPFDGGTWIQRRVVLAGVGATFAVGRAWNEGSGEPAPQSAFDSQLVVELMPRWRSTLVGSSLAAVSWFDVRL